MNKKLKEIAAHWTNADEEKFQTLIDLHAATTSSLDFMRAARERKITPTELQSRIDKEKARQDKVIVRLIDWSKLRGAKITHGKVEDGVFGKTTYVWTIAFPLTGNRRLEFNFERCYHVEVYDIPMSFCWMFIHGKKKRAPEGDDEFQECETAAELTRYIKRALVWINKFTPTKIELKTPLKV